MFSIDARQVFLLFVLCRAESVVAATIYSGAFDYKKFSPPAAYLLPENKSKLSRLCKSGRGVSTADLAVCEFFEYQNASRTLTSVTRKMVSHFSMVDRGLKKNGEPLSLPYFISSKKNWEDYRANYCYSTTYEMGEASMKYEYFWGCMTKITRARTEQLEEFLRYSEE